MKISVNFRYVNNSRFFLTMAPMGRFVQSPPFVA